MPDPILAWTRLFETVDLETRPGGGRRVLRRWASALLAAAVHQWQASTLRRPRLRPDHALGDPRRDPGGPGLPDRALRLLRQHPRNGSPLNPVERLHEAYGGARRARVLARQLERAAAPSDGSLLDVGCGDGEIDRLIGDRAPPTSSIEGIDVWFRPDASIRSRPSTAGSIPHPDDSFDGVPLRRRAPPQRRRRRSCCARPGGWRASFVLIKDHTARRPARRSHPALHGRRRQRAPRCRAALQLLESRALARGLRRASDLVNRELEAGARHLPLARELDLRARPALHRAPGSRLHGDGSRAAGDP